MAARRKYHNIIYYSHQGEKPASPIARYKDFGYTIKVIEQLKDVVPLISDLPVLAVIFHCENEALEEQLPALINQLGGNIPVLVQTEPSFGASLMVLKAGGSGLIAHDAEIELVIERIEQFKLPQIASLSPLLLVEQTRSKSSNALGVELGAQNIEINIVSPETVFDVLQRTKPQVLIIGEVAAVCSQWELISLIKQVPDFSSIPVLFLSNESAIVNRLGPIAFPGCAFLPDTATSDEVIRACRSLLHEPEERCVDVASLDRRDQLTGFYNHEYFVAELEQAFKEYEEGKPNIALYYIEIDKFDAFSKNCEEFLVHTLVKEVSNAIADLSGKRDVVCRYTDKVFTVISFGRDTTQSRQFANALLKRVRNRPVKVAGRAVNMSLSIGICFMEGSFESAHDVLSQADILVQGVQETGGNGVQLYHHRQAEHKARARRKRWEKRISEGNFRIGFQPIIELQGDSKPKYEMLFRMIRREILPEQFLRVAESTGVIERIDMEMARRAIDMVKRHTATVPLTLFLNVSTKTLECDLYSDWLLDKLSKSHIPKGSLAFLINEEDIPRFSDEIKRFVDLVKELGQSVVLKQSSAASCSNSMKFMREIKADYLKVNRLFTHRLQKESKYPVQLKSLVQYGGQIGCQVIGGYVDDATTLSILWQSGVPLVQGYFIQRPLGGMNYEF